MNRVPSSGCAKLDMFVGKHQHITTFPSASLAIVSP